ncbi:hypothetical protein ACSBR2_041183 [Camellia fascicularis]
MEKSHPVEAFGCAARDTSSVLSPFQFSRRPTGEKDVTFQVLYCGICHSDVHAIKNEWGNTSYPCLPGCGNDLENYCPKVLATYNSTYYDGTPTYGGYSDIMVADEHFVIRIPDNLPLDACAPLLCAGITTYSPLRLWTRQACTSPAKKKEAVERLGVDSFLVSHDPDQMQVAMGTMNGIIDTISASHPILPLIGLLKSHGKLILVGAPEKPLEFPVFPLLIGRKIVAASGIGGIKETQEMIDFAAKHNVTADIEVIPVNYVNTAMERLVKADIRYRFVIDIGIH